MPADVGTTGLVFSRYKDSGVNFFEKTITASSMDPAQFPVFGDPTDAMFNAAAM